MLNSLSNNKSASITALELIALGCIWVLMALLVNPTGEFPLNDDWSFSRAVQSLIDHGRLQFTGLDSMTLIAQVFWGALFCLPFGFSFTALRLSTLVLGLVGIFVTYGLFREVKTNRTTALLAALTVAINPLYFELSFTFMTDVPFFAFSMLSILFLMRGIRQESNIELLAGNLFVCLAILIRQLGIIIPLSFGIAYLAKNGVTRKTLQTALLPIVLSVSILIAYQIWMQSTTGLSPLYNRGYDSIFESSTGFLQAIKLLVYRFLVELTYLGLFTLPFLIILTINKWKTASHRGRLLSVLTSSGFFVAVMGALIWKNRTMPLSGNVLFDIGLGPATLRDVYNLGLPHLSNAPKALWLVITTAGAFGGALMLRYLFSALAQVLLKLSKFESIADKWPLILFLSACTSYSVLIGVIGFFDRYLIPLLPLSMIAMITTGNSFKLRVSRSPVFIAAVLLFVYGFFALGATHDYLSWNRSRWKALHYLMEEAHISYKNIDGGYEFNGWYSFDAKYRVNPSKSWWWVDNDDYIISFGPMIGYSEMKRYPYKRWIPFGQGNIFVLHRLADSKASESALDENPLQ